MRSNTNEYRYSTIEKNFVKQLQYIKNIKNISLVLIIQQILKMDKLISIKKWQVQNKILLVMYFVVLRVQMIHHDFKFSKIVTRH